MDSVLNFMSENYIVILSIIFVTYIVLYIIKVYNEMINLRNDVEQSSSGILIQLRKKVDLIPNLAKTVKRYSEHEKDTLTEIVKIRESLKNSLENGKLTKDIMNLYKKLTSLLHGLNIKVEAYPQLKADKHYIKLLDELRDIEDNIAAARRIYNSSVYEYNTYIEAFPHNFIATPFNFTREDFFDTDENIEELAENIDIDHYVR